MATVLITGGTGMIGTAVTKELAGLGYRIIILTRDPMRFRNTDQIRYAGWDPSVQTIDVGAVQDADYIIHLAGANVAEGRWTKKRKEEIVDSRVESGQLLVKAMSENTNHIKAVISSSAIGYYGPDPEIPNARPFKETDPPYHDFLSSVVKKWEAAIALVKQQNKRLVILRTGIVLSNEGGAYTEFKKPLRFGVAAVLGSGRQVVSWIHIKDLVRMYIRAIENESMDGIYNAVAPGPVTNRQLVLSIARQKSNYLPVHVPSFILKTMLGEMSIEVLKSATVSSAKIQDEGFVFQYANVEAAVKQLENGV
jgi:uncharacterized protein (TIGR01777 family)